MASTAVNAHMSSFFDEVVRSTPTNPNLENCIQCGTCGGSCPSGADMDHTPRAIFAMIEAGLKQEVLRSNTQWYCVSCYYCMVRCPQEVHITDIMYALKRMSIREGQYKESSTPDTPEFSSTFIEYVENNGRSFELGLATRYHLKHHPLDMLKMASMGMGMLRRHRMDLAPRKIKGIASLQKILAKARQLEEEMLP